MTVENEAAVRLNRYLAMAGVAARRKADELIAAGRVTINGEAVPAGGRLVRPAEDTVELDGRAVVPRRTHRYFAVNKPPGYLSAVSDRSHRPLVTSLVQPSGRDGGLHPVGRLDLRSRGLVILTDDGELSFRLQHPRHHVEKEYLVEVAGHPDSQALDRLRSGIDLEEGRTGRAHVEVLPGKGENARFRVILRQGWKRQLRRMFAAVGARVLDLQRTRIGPLVLDDLAEGQARALTDVEVLALRSAVGLG